nr:uncharacterized protein LOC129284130 [Lytechinus pictus]
MPLIKDIDCNISPQCRILLILKTRTTLGKIDMESQSDHVKSNNFNNPSKIINLQTRYNAVEQREREGPEEQPPHVAAELADEISLVGRNLHPDGNRRDVSQAHRQTPPLDERLNATNDLERRRARTLAILSQEFRDVTVSRSNIETSVSRLYRENQTLPRFSLHVNFNGEEGEDFDGLTSEMFTLFWESVYRSYFTGIRRLSPRISPTHDLSADTWQIIGRILSHGYVLSNFLPTQITYSTMYYLFTGNEPTTREYVSSFLNTLSERNETFLNRAMRSNPAVPRFQEPFQTNLVAILSHYGATALPSPRSINTIISQIARYQLHLQPFYALYNIRTGMLRSHDSIWNPRPSNYSIFHIFNLFHPTPDNVIDHFDVEYSNVPLQRAIEERIVEWITRFIFTLTIPQLMILLRFITSSNIVNGQIRITFDGNVDPHSPIRVATCGRQLIISRNILSYEAIEDFLLNVINNPDVWNSFDII